MGSTATNTGSFRLTSQQKARTVRSIVFGVVCILSLVSIDYLPKSPLTWGEKVVRQSLRQGFRSRTDKLLESLKYFVEFHFELVVMVLLTVVRYLVKDGFPGLPPSAWTHTDHDWG